jgi:hypothetical protein
VLDAYLRSSRAVDCSSKQLPRRAVHDERFCAVLVLASAA